MIQYSNEVAEEICLRLVSGESLSEICRDEHMPAKSSVLAWLDDPAKKSFADQYASARARQYAAMGDEILEIVDAPGDVADKRLRFDARRWMLSKMLPKVYGDKLDLTVNDKRTAEELSTDELHRIAAAGSTRAPEAASSPDEPRTVH